MKICFNVQQRTFSLFSLFVLCILLFLTSIFFPHYVTGNQDSGASVYAYIASGETGLYIFNIDNPQVPYYVSLCDTPGIAKGIAIRDEYACIADGEGGLQIIDIVNENRPEIIGSYDFHGNATDVSVEGEYAFVTDSDSGLRIFYIGNKTEPVHLGSCGTPGSAQGVAIAGNYAYIADSGIHLTDPNGDAVVRYSGLRIIDIQSKAGPETTESDCASYYAFNLAIMGDYAYIANPRKGPYLYEFAKENFSSWREIDPNAGIDLSRRDYKYQRGSLNTISPALAFQVVPSFGLGFSLDISDSLTLALDVYHTRWDRYVLKYPSGDERSPINKKDKDDADVRPTTQVRLGSEYFFQKPGRIIPIRVGAFYDPEPAGGRPDDIFGLSFGSGISYNELFSLDFIYQFRFGHKREAESFQGEDIAGRIAQHYFYASMIYYLF